MVILAEKETMLMLKWLLYIWFSLFNVYLDLSLHLFIISFFMFIKFIENMLLYFIIN